MDRTQIDAEFAKPITQELLGSAIPARFSYVGLDGDPRVVPISFHWDGENVVCATLPKAAKVKALRANPCVAITIDTQEQWPPRVLLIRGAARVEAVQGVPEAYVEGSRKITPAEVFPEWEQNVRAMYDEMVLITVVPDWVKLMDFETTIPKAVEDLAREKFGS